MYTITYVFIYSCMCIAHMPTHSGKVYEVYYFLYHMSYAYVCNEIYIMIYIILKLYIHLFECVLSVLQRSMSGVCFGERY